MALFWRPNGLSSSGPTWLSRQLALSDAAYWVDSVTGSDSTGTGEEWAPLATVFGASGALSLATNNASNLIICKATHRETVSSAYTWAKAGVTLVSLGSGTARAQFTSSVAGVMITTSAADVRVENCYFVQSTATTTSRFTIGAAGCELRDCQFDMGATDTTDGVLVNAVADVVVKGCTFKAVGRPSGTTQRGLRATGAATNLLVEDCIVDGGTVGFTDSGLKLDNGSADRFRLRGLTLQNYGTAKVSATGIKGLASYAADATSRLEWTE